MVTAFGIGQEAPVTLEVAVSLILVWGLGVEVDSLVVDLPYFNEGVAKGATFCIHNHTAKVGHRPDRRCDLVVHEKEVIVSVQRQPVRVKRAFNISRSSLQGLSESTWHCEKCCCSCGCLA